MDIITISKKLRFTPNTFLALAVLAGMLFLGLLFWLIKPSAPDTKAELQTLSQAVRHHFQKQIDYHGLNTDFAITQGIVPAKMVRAKKIFSKNASEILIGADLDGRTIAAFQSSFGIIYKSLDKNKCQNLVLSNFDETSGLLSITISNNNTYEFTYGGELSLPISAQDAEKYCGAKNTVMFTFE